MSVGPVWVRVIGAPPGVAARDLVTLTPDGRVHMLAPGHDPDDWPVVDPQRSTRTPYR